jgi:hypothetical protein
MRRQRADDQVGRDAPTSRYEFPNCMTKHAFKQSNNTRKDDS